MVEANSFRKTEPLDKISVGTVQISEKRDQAMYLPYALGLLQSYAQAHAQDPERYDFYQPFIQRTPVYPALEHLQGAQIAAFSVYIWNVKRSLTIAEALKQKRPETLIILGGPQVPTQERFAKAFLQEAPWVDVLVQGEGEQVFLALLEAFPGNQWQDIPGIAYRDSEGQFRQNPQGERLKNIDSIPSPYLNGYFEPVIAAFQGMSWVATWETNRGCPFSCAFCDWGGLIQSRVYRFDEERIRQEVQWFGEQNIDTVYSADANFGMLPRDMQIVEWMAEVKEQQGWPRLLHVQTAKNVRKRNLEIHQRLYESGLGVGASLSLQSLHPPVLKAIRRENISQAAYQDLQHFCLQRGIFSHTDLIIGLPDETYDSFAEGISQVIAMGQHNDILFHNASILPNAEMAKPEYQQEYGLQLLTIPFPGHTSIDPIQESIDVIIGSRSATQQDWVRMQSLAWMTNFLYFTFKPLQIVFMVLHTEMHLSYRALIEAFCLQQAQRTHPVVTKVYCTMLNLAQRYAAGESWPKDNPLFFSPQEGIHLTPDHMLQRHLAQQGLWPAFFREAENLLFKLIYRDHKDFDTALFQDALKLSQAHFYQHFFGMSESNLPVGTENTVHELQLRYNLWDFYEAQMQGRNCPIKKEATRFRHLAPSGSTKGANYSERPEPLHT